VRELIAHPQRIAAMSARARGLGHPHAAREVLRAVLRDSQ